MELEIQNGPIQQQVPQWSLAGRIAFRFCLAYFGLFCIASQILTSLVPLPGDGLPELNTLAPVRDAIFWVAEHLFHAKLPLVYDGSGSGDKIFDWVWLCCVFILALLATAIWSFVDRKRRNYSAAFLWFRLFIRFALAGQMISYGTVKVIPLQMPYPNLMKLLQPFHDFSPMGVLWASIGSSPAYETFSGSAELLGGILLILPATALIGSLVCLAVMTEVFVLNMTYDVPVKILSFHLVSLSLFLLAPEFRRLADFFFRNRPVGPSTQAVLFRSGLANRIALFAQVTFGMWLLGMNAYAIWGNLQTFGFGRPHPSLYGIWNVDELAIDGQMRPPLLVDSERWRRVVFDDRDSVAFQRMDDSFARYRGSIDAAKGTVSLTKSNDKKWKALFTFQRVAKDGLILDGEMDSRSVHMRLALVDRSHFVLVNRGFHWIQDFPFNR